MLLLKSPLTCSMLTDDTLELLVLHADGVPP